MIHSLLMVFVLQKDSKHVNGDQALKFIRSRKEEGAGGDFVDNNVSKLCLKRWPIRLQAHHRLHILIV